MKHTYSSPTLTVYGMVGGITAAIGGNPEPDDSNFAQIPADTGSQDICIGRNTRPGQVECGANRN